MSPPGSQIQANEAPLRLSASIEKPLLMIYLPGGPLLPLAKFVDRPKEFEQSPAGEYSKQLLEYVGKKHCKIRLAE